MLYRKIYYIHLLWTPLCSPFPGNSSPMLRISPVHLDLTPCMQHYKKKGKEQMGNIHIFLQELVLLELYSLSILPVTDDCWSISLFPLVRFSGIVHQFPSARGWISLMQDLGQCGETITAHQAINTLLKSQFTDGVIW